MNNNQIPFNRPFVVGKELYNIAQAVIEKGHLAGGGPFTKACHKWLEERLGAKKALLTHSCTGALEMAAILLGIEPGDEVIMPSYTFVSTANAFVLRGGVPVFIDIRPDTLNLDEKQIEQAITPKTKAIVPVHYAGIACEMDEILDIADRYNISVVEDAAQSLLSVYKGHCTGALGHMGCLSFHETKNIISGEGGALLINDDRYIERAEIIWEKGTNRQRFFRGEVDKYTWIDLGSSFLPSELVGAFLHAQLEQAEKIISKRCRLFQRYYKLLSPLAEKGVIGLPYMNNVVSCNGHLFFIITGAFNERCRLIRFLNSRNVSSVFHYVPLHSSPAGRKFGRTSGDLIHTEELSERVLRLPLYYEMTEKEIDAVVSAINQFYENSTC